MDEAIMEEVVRGREFADELRQILVDVAVVKMNHAHHLLNNILNSFTNTLFLLNKHQNQIKDFSFTTKSEDSQDSSATGRGSYKRRKSTETWEKVSESETDDGHQWRKYGQKTIQTSKYARNYYRCSHKFEERCDATKQVQRIQEKPPLYKSTYYTHHTCKYLPNPADIIFDPPHHTNSSILLSFNNTFPTPTKQDCSFLSSSSFSCNKEELVIPSPNNSFDIDHQHLPPPVHQHIILDDNTPPPPPPPPLLSTLQFHDHDDDIMYGLFYHDSLHHHDDHFFHPFPEFS
ncbi:WRKY DNA-binding transcription factor 70-like [Cicer arietinum]|uniref:WRKY DNA-binding transcription factor 70-like n=1 Tax=Cicer arietinum TaxID=3827 RepID=A0A1S3EDS2_CICAR|nr:WRKY DNA-binding transcription factor 70-like [Cicer arietinum]